MAESLILPPRREREFPRQVKPRPQRYARNKNAVHLKLTALLPWQCLFLVIITIIVNQFFYVSLRQLGHPQVETKYWVQEWIDRHHRHHSQNQYNQLLHRLLSKC